MPIILHEEVAFLSEDSSIVAMLVQAFEAFSKSADRLSSAYGQMVRGSREEPAFPAGLAVSLRLLTGALDRITDGVIIIDKDGRIIAFNTTAGDLTKLNPKDVIGKPYQEVFDERYILETLRTGTDNHYRRRLHPKMVGQPPRSAKHVQRRQGKSPRISAYTAPIVDEDGVVYGAVEILTSKKQERRQATRLSLPVQAQIGSLCHQGEEDNQKAGGQISDLSSRNSEDSSLSAAKLVAIVGDIIANIAHRMKSPLGAIQLFAELLKQDLDDDKQEIVEDILAGVHSVDAVLSNLLSFAQPIRRRLQKVDLIAVLDESLLFASSAIKQQGISLKKEYAPSPLYCQGDLEQLKQVCFNLILNAIQAMPEGGELRVSAGYSNDPRFINIEIEDSGCGIPDESMDRVFTPFFTTKEGGTGLGLYVVYKIIQAHHGNVRLKSTYGHGTTVSIQLPVGDLTES